MRREGLQETSRQRNGNIYVRNNEQRDNRICSGKKTYNGKRYKRGSRNFPTQGNNYPPRSMKRQSGNNYQSRLNSRQEVNLCLSNTNERSYEPEQSIIHHRDSERDTSMIVNEITGMMTDNRPKVDSTKLGSNVL